ncbi:MAG: L-lactate permease [Microbacteriaceae bacterium]
MLSIAALAPLITVCVALAMRLSAIKSALLGIVAIIVLYFLFFPFDQEMILVTADALWMPILEIALIILGGILIAEVLDSVGAQSYITQHLIAATGTRERATLLMVLGLVPFLESSIGYGLGIIITVPLLRKLGHSPSRSVALSLFGLTLTPWGSLGPGLIITSELGGISVAELGQALAFVQLPVLFLLNAAILLLAVPREKLRRYSLEVFLITLVMSVVLVITNLYISVPLGGLFASLFAVLTTLGISRLRGTNVKTLLEMKLLISAAPYLIIILGVVLSSAIVPLFGVPIATRISTSPATWLLLSALISAPLLSINGQTMLSLLGKTLKRWIRPGTTILLYIIFGGLLNASGMSTELAVTASTLGLWNLLLIPGVNIIAGYVTASVSAHAAMFSLSTAQTAIELGLTKSSLLALQTISGATATIVAPSRFALAAAGLAAYREDEDGAAQRGLRQEAPLQTGKIVALGLGIGILALPFCIAIAWYLGQI